MNAFNVETTRQLSLGLLAASGALLFTALNLVGAGISGGDTVFASKVSSSTWPLASSALASLIALICAEIAGHENTPEKGHPHSRPNYLQTAFALLVVSGLGQLLYGAWMLLSAASVSGPTTP